MNFKTFCSIGFLFCTTAFASIAEQAAGEKSSDAKAKEVVSSAFSAQQKQELMKLVLTIIEKNPQAIKQSLEKYLALEAAQQAEKEAQLAKKRIQDNQKELFQSASTPFIGAKEAPKTLVIFVDPYCGYCRKSLEDLERLVSENKDVHVSVRHLAILGSNSEWAVKALIASKKQGKYDVFHTALKKTNQPLDKSQLIDLAQTLGLELAAFKLQLEQAEVRQEYEKNMTLAATLGVSATPTLIIGDRMLQGYIPLAEVQAQVRLPVSGENAQTSQKVPEEEAPKKS